MPAKTLICIYSGASGKNLSFFSSKSKGGSNFSGVIYSQKIINGFSGIYKEIISILIPPVSWWPKHSKLLFVKPLPTGQTDVFDVSFCNIVGLRNMSISKNIKKVIKRNLTKIVSRNNPVDLLIFDAGYPQIDAIHYLKKYFPLAKATLIVPDLPELTGVSNRNHLYHFLKRIDSFCVYKASKKSVDSFVFFVGEMAKKFQAKNRPYLISEGVAGKMQDKSVVNRINAQKRVVYTGIVSDYYANISLTIESIEKVNESIGAKFLIAGPCQDKALLAKIAKSPFSEYLGTVSPEEAANLQSNADVLVNLRPNLPNFKFSFPSKLISYLQTGKPVVASHLDSIPEKYNDILFYPKELTVKEISSTIIKVLSLTGEELEELYSKEANLIDNLSPKIIDFQIAKLFDKSRDDD